MIYHHWGQRTSLQSHDNAKLVQILPKVVVKLIWETRGEQVRDTEVGRAGADVCGLGRSPGMRAWGQRWPLAEGNHRAGLLGTQAWLGGEGRLSRTR